MSISSSPEKNIFISSFLNETCSETNSYCKTVCGQTCGYLTLSDALLDMPDFLDFFLLLCDLCAFLECSEESDDPELSESEEKYLFCRELLCDFFDLDLYLLSDSDDSKSSEDSETESDDESADCSLLESKPKDLGFRLAFFFNLALSLRSAALTQESLS